MLYAIRFFDKPDAFGVRASNMAAHLKWLATHHKVILIGGSLREDQETAPVGALWIAQSDDREALDALLRSDPFWTAGLRDRYEIHSWHKAFPEPVPI